MKEKIIELAPIRESPADFDELEKRLRKFFRDYFYLPLLKELDLPKKTIQNAAHSNPLMDALFSGRVGYQSGIFSGEFSASIAKELKALGATFDKKTAIYRLDEARLPQEMKNLISASQLRFVQSMAKLDQKLSEVVPSKLTEQLKCADIFDQSLFKADKSFEKNVKHLSTVPRLSDSQRERISLEWQNNMKLWIAGWTEDQIKTLRKGIFEDIVKGARRESFIPPILKITKTIQDSHDEAVNKAKFLAHQESRLLMAKFKEVRYTDAGIHEYIWRCVHRPHDESPKKHTPGNVRYQHGKLDGQICRWDAPPITTNPGQPTRRNNPGQDYNCRCFARPILRVKSA